jgi:hypothetical protein
MKLVAMSELGQNRKSMTATRMSGVGGKADLNFRRLDVCLSQEETLERRWKGAVHCIKSRHRSQSTRASIYRFVFDNRKLLWADSTRPQISKKAPTVLR